MTTENSNMEGLQNIRRSSETTKTPPDPEKFKRLLKVEDTDDTQKRNRRQKTKKQEENEEDEITFTKSPDHKNFSSQFHATHSKNPLLSHSTQGNPRSLSSQTKTSYSQRRSPRQPHISSQQKSSQPQDDNNMGEDKQQVKSKTKKSSASSTSFLTSDKKLLKTQHKKSQTTGAEIAESYALQTSSASSAFSSDKELSHIKNKNTKIHTKKTQAPSTAQSLRTSHHRILQKSPSLPSTKKSSPSKTMNDQHLMKTKQAQTHRGATPAMSRQQQQKIHKGTDSIHKNNHLSHIIKGTSNMPIQQSNSSIKEQSKEGPLQNKQHHSSQENVTGNPVPNLIDTSSMTQELKNLPLCAKLSPQMFEIFEQIVGALQIVASQGTLETTITLSRPGHPLDQTTISLKQFPSLTPPHHVDMEFYGVPAASQDYIDRHIPLLQAAFAQAGLNADIKIFSGGNKKLSNRRKYKVSPPRQKGSS